MVLVPRVRKMALMSRFPQEEWPTNPTGNEHAAANVTRTYSLGATSIAIFTFSMFFLYPRFTQGEINAVLFQATVLALGVATFSFAFASLYYYMASLGGRFGDAERLQCARRGDRYWLIGYTLLFLVPSLVLFSLRLFVVAFAWLGLWLAYVVFVTHTFPRVRSE